MCIAKTLNIFYEKTQIARVKILSMKQFPVSVFKFIQVKALGSKLALACGTLIFLINYVYSKNLKIFFEKTK
jgi:hypothetical protein